MGSTLGSIISLVLVVLYIIAFWKIFQKSGEKGWKSIIPIYNEYVWFKLTWKTSMFWIAFICSFAGSIIMSIGGAQFDSEFNMISNTGNPATNAIGGILMLVTCIIYIMQCFKASKAYGHGTGYGLGLLFLDPIFIMILGFGKSEYKGAQQ